MQSIDKCIVQFIGIGAPKSATSWIFQCLKEHPELCVSHPKETFFFSKNFLYKKGLRFYRTFFSHCKADKIRGEYSTNYMVSPKAAERIYKHFPKVKIIASLRNPIDRAISHYTYGLASRGRLSIYNSFEEAIQKDKNLIEKGFYHKQLNKFYEIFPRENIHIELYDDLKKDAEGSIKRIYQFLGVKNVSFIPVSIKKSVLKSDSFAINTRIPLLNRLLYNLRTVLGKSTFLESKLINSRIHKLGKQIIKRNQRLTRNKSKSEPVKITPHVTEKLFQIYKQDIEKLERLIDRDLSEWKYRT